MDDATWGWGQRRRKTGREPVEGGFGEDAGGVDADVDVTGAEREARARATLARLVAEVLEGYPAEARWRAAAAEAGRVGGGRGRDARRGGGRGAVGEEAAAALLASEARALRGALERLVVGS